MCNLLPRQGVFAPRMCGLVPLDSRRHRESYHWKPLYQQAGKLDPSHVSSESTHFGRILKGLDFLDKTENPPSRHRSTKLRLLRAMLVYESLQQPPKTKRGKEIWLNLTQNLNGQVACPWHGIYYLSFALARRDCLSFTDSITQLGRVVPGFWSTNTLPLEDQMFSVVTILD